MSLKFVALSGVYEIGRNCYLYFDSDKMEGVIVDVGSKLGKPMDPHDNYLPNFSLINNLGIKIKCIIITHGHEDHIGGLKFLGSLVKNIPRGPELFADTVLYANEITSAIVQKKVGKIHLKGLDMPDVKTTIVPEKKFIPINDDFSFALVRINHSIPGACGIMFKKGKNTIFHTGDFRIERNPVLEKDCLEEIKTFVEANVHQQLDVMVADSTNCFTDLNDKALSEKESFDNMQNMVKDPAYKDKCIFLTCFASSVFLMYSAIAAAHSVDRKIVVGSGSIQQFIDIGFNEGLIPNKYKNIVINHKRLEEAMNYPRNKLFYLISGTQGESNAKLAKAAMGYEEYIKLGADAVVIFGSRIIPGNELSVYQLRDAIYGTGATIGFNKIHVSGHAFSSEYQEMYKTLNPKYGIAMHGHFFQMTRQKELVASLNIPVIAPKPGDIIDLASNPLKISEHIHIEQHGICNNSVLVAENDPSIKERQIMGKNGVCICVLRQFKSKITNKRSYKVEAFSINGNVVDKEAQMVCYKDLQNYFYNYKHENVNMKEVKKVIMDSLHRFNVRGQSVPYVIIQITGRNEQRNDRRNNNSSYENNKDDRRGRSYSNSGGNNYNRRNNNYSRRNSGSRDNRDNSSSRDRGGDSRDRGGDNRGPRRT